MSRALIFVVEHRTGGWGGTEVFTSISRAFSTREKADAYVAAYRHAITTGMRHDLLDDFEIHRVELDYDDV